MIGAPMRKSPKVLLSLFLMTVITHISGCTPNREDTLVFEAQSCLNRVPLDQPQAAAACIEKVEKLDTPAAHQIKCSGAFLLQGFSSPTRLTLIAEQLASAGNAGSLSTLGAIGLLAFTGSNARYEAEKALLSCQKAGSKGMTLLASMANLATIMNDSHLGDINSNCTGSNVDPQNCSQAVKQILCHDPNLFLELGTVAIFTYNNVCRYNLEADPMCRVYAEATQHGTQTNPALVGQNMRNHLTNSNSTSNLCN